MRRLTDWVEFDDEHGTRCRIRASYGLEKIGQQEPYVSVTAVTQRRDERGHWHGHCGGCQHELVAEHFPELRPLIRWHLCNATTGPMHYIANAVYWAEQGDANAFKATVVFGAVEGDELPELGLTLGEQPEERRARIERWCEARVPALLEALREDLQLCDRPIAGGRKRRETTLLEDLCRQHDIRLDYLHGTSEPIPEDLAEVPAWTVTLGRYPTGAQRTKGELVLTLTTPFFSNHEPRHHDVLDALLLDADAAAYESFEEWADSFGLSSDSIKARRTYRACLRTAERLRAFLGELYDEFRAAAG